MSREELLLTIGNLLAGLAVPRSIYGGANLGAAREPWDKIHNELVGLGWHSRLEYAAALEEKLKCD